MQAASSLETSRAAWMRCCMHTCCTSKQRPSLPRSCAHRYPLHPNPFQSPKTLQVHFAPALRPALPPSHALSGGARARGTATLDCRRHAVSAAVMLSAHLCMRRIGLPKTLEKPVQSASKNCGADMLRRILGAQIASYPALRGYLERLALACDATVPRPPPVRPEGWQREDASRCSDFRAYSKP